MTVPNPPGSGKDIAEGKGVHREVESEESRILARIFRLNGFETVGAVCKAGSQNKTDIGVEECYTKVTGGLMCNPILQALYQSRAYYRRLLTCATISS